MFLKWIKNCRLCGNPNLTEVIDLGDMPSQGFFHYKDKLAPPTRKIPTKIVRCDTQKWENGCGLVQNEVIVPPEILYSNYGYLSSISQTMIKHLKSLNSKICEIKGNLHGDIVCDIGCNDGCFLSAYDKEVIKIGIDPSDIAKSVKGDIKIINKCFPAKELDEYKNSISVLTAFACFYDILDIKNALNKVESLLTKNGIFVIEVAYLPTVLDNLCYDGLVHEHISLFSLATLEYALDKAGLKAFRAEKTLTNSGSLLLFICKKDCEEFDNVENFNKLHNLRLEEFGDELDEEKTYENFREKVGQHARDLKMALTNLKNVGQTIGLDGCSTKINTLICANQLENFIDYGIERTNAKIGGKTTWRLTIIGEREAREKANKDTVWIIGPYHFVDEIIIREKEMISKGVKFLIPLPSIRIIE